MAVMAATASAESTCTYDPATKTLTFNQGGGPSTFGVTVTAGGTFSSDSGSCAGASTANTEQIVANNGSVPLDMDLAGPLTGGTAEGDGGSEIEVNVGGTGRVVVADSTNRGTSTVLGRSGSGQLQVNLNAEVATDNDADLVAPSGFAGVTVGAGPLNDTLTTGGGRGTGTPLINPSSTNLDGGPGNDHLTGGAELDGGDGNDTLNAIGPRVFIAINNPLSALRFRADRSGTEVGADGRNGTDTFSGFANINLTVSGTPFADAIYGSEEPDLLVGAAGNDRIVGNGGQDFLHGNEGADEFGIADDQRDLVDCGAGVDTSLGRADGADALTACEFGPATMSIADAAAKEGDEVAFVVTLSDPLAFDARATLRPAAGTAGDSDVRTTDVAVVIPAGATSTTVSVPTLEDGVLEDDETFTATLTQLSAAPAPGDVVATGTITDDEGTVTLIALSPDAADGGADFYVSAPLVTVAPETPARAAETRCALDPLTVPADFAALPATPCPYLGAGASVETDGSHVVYAATRTLSGETGPVVVRAFTVDRTAPDVTCGALPGIVRAGETGRTLSASVTDAGSGPVARSLSVALDTTSAGAKTVALTGADRAGNRRTTTCTYTVQRPIPVVLCGGAPIVLLDVLPERGRVRITGAVLDTYAGQSVRILAGSRPVGTVTASADGSFSTLVPAPARRLRATIRYQAQVADKRSRALRLERRLVITSRRGRTVTGRLAAPARSRPRTITLYRQLTCEQRRLFKRVKLQRNGTFRVTLDAPSAGEPYALYRVTTALRRGKTFTLPIVVR